MPGVLLQIGTIVYLALHNLENLAVETYAIFSLLIIFFKCSMMLFNAVAIKDIIERISDERINYFMELQPNVVTNGVKHIKRISILYGMGVLSVALMLALQSGLITKGIINFI